MSTSNKNNVELDMNFPLNESTPMINIESECTNNVITKKAKSKTKGKGPIPVKLNRVARQ